MILDRGELWSALRSTLPRLRSELRQAVESADKYDMESICFDQIARKLADAVEQQAAKGRK